jgi:hypothetical protein
MPPRENSYVTLWHAANAGDVGYLQQRMSKAFTADAKAANRDEEMFDSEVLENRLLRTAFPTRLLNFAPALPGFSTSDLPVVYETKSLRLVIESVTERSFAAHGYYTDLSLERRFADLLLEIFGKDQIASEMDAAIAKVFGADRTRMYSCTGALDSKLVVGAIAFSDFATFSVEGYIISSERLNLSEPLRIAIQELLESIEPS